MAHDIVTESAANAPVAMKRMPPKAALGLHTAANAATTGKKTRRRNIRTE